MSKIKSITAGECEVCGEETDIDSPQVCYGCAANEERVSRMRFAVTIGYEVVGSTTRAAQDLAVRGGYRWTLHAGMPCGGDGPTGRQELVSGVADTFAEADAEAREAVEALCAPPVHEDAAATEKVPF